MTMPGLPKKPAAVNIDIDDKGNISGLFDNFSGESRVAEKKILSARSAMGVVGRAVASETIRRKIRALPQYPAAKQLAAFAALPEEADIWPLLEDRWEKQAAVALPRITSFSAVK